MELTCAVWRLWAMQTPPTKAAGFRAKADECHGLALRSNTTEDRARWLDLASAYLKLAQGLEERVDRSASSEVVVEFPDRQQG